MRSLVVIGMLGTVALLAGCGEDATAVQKEPASPQGIFVSSGDCASAGTLTIDQCGQAIDRAVAFDQKNAPTYGSLASCNKAQGPGRCAKAVDGAYRANIQAFLVTMSKKPRATALYAANDGSIGFADAEKNAFGVESETYTVSTSAQALAHENAHLKN
ncbi:hypothetical protein DLM45_14165 [Hyphomicrobium methylovorum]|uniref:DUF1190 domain-containing protein n=1 Tax=Hyphomicrobium methylovorum TaxID=84 RepID=UPI0015E6734F|nr:DUF1190 domain-containing protein [Hyphomicrobium methylovorum]MBA2127359.1 hypothetical protein [Hyphomicrobium methylovorum]